MSVVDTRLSAIEARLSAVESRLSSGGGAAAPRPESGGIASDADLDSDYGDETVKKDPKKWVDEGRESYAGCRMSECPSDYLRMLASLFDWMANKDEESGNTYKNKQGKEVPVAPINRKKAARARGWAKRNEGRAAAAPDAAQSPSQSSDEMDIPF